MISAHLLLLDTPSTDAETTGSPVIPLIQSWCPPSDCACDVNMLIDCVSFS